MRASLAADTGGGGGGKEHDENIICRASEPVRD